MLVDVHCHLDHIDFREDIDKVIERAKQAGVSVIIANGISPETNRIVLELSKKYGIVKPALGIYPIDALTNEIKAGEYPLKTEPFNIDEEIEFIKKQKIIALGEVGLDFKDGKQYEKQQKEVFSKFIALAEKMKKPIIVHSRKAEQDVIEMLESSSIKKAVLHCFSGKFKLVKKGADLGYHFSIPTNVVRSQQFQDLVKEVNINQLLSETDAPYLSPFPGRRNEPAFVIESVKKIAEIKKFEFEEVEKNLFLNFQRLF